MGAETRRVTEPWRRIGVVAIALLLYALTSIALHLGWYQGGRTTDVPIYRGYGQLIRAGAIPYRDFIPVYPPAALPVFTAPTLLPLAFAKAFALEMFLCGAAVLACAELILDSLGTGLRSRLVTLGFIALLPLTLGSVLDSRFDLWPTALLVGALAAILRGRGITAGVLLGTAVAAKIFPIVVAPVCLAYLWRHYGRRRALGATAAGGAVLVAWFAPFVVASASGVGTSLGHQLGRPLQVESLAASALIAAHHVGGLRIHTVTSYGSQNLAGATPEHAAAVTTLVQAAVLAVVWITFIRRRTPTRNATVTAVAACVASFVAFGKVLSPQYLVWLIPLVPLIRGRRGVHASALLVTALLLTQAWFPRHYWALATSYAAPQWWLLVARDVILVALVVTLAWPLPEATGDDVLSPRVRPRLRRPRGSPA
jgi:hypothetical protein